MVLGLQGLRLVLGTCAFKDLDVGLNQHIALSRSQNVGTGPSSGTPQQRKKDGRGAHGEALFPVRNLLASTLNP